MQKKIFFVKILLACFILSSCSAVKFAKYYVSSNDPDKGYLAGNVYKTKSTSFRIGELSREWNRVNTSEGGLFFWNKKTESTTTVNSTCKPAKKKYSLAALSNSLVIGIKDKDLIERRVILVDGEDSLLSIYGFEENNQNLSLATVVTKKEDCVYDFSFSSRDNFDQHFHKFLEFVAGFKVLD